MGRRAVVTVVGIIDVLVVILFVVLAVREGQKTAVMDILLAPQVAKVEIDGAEYQAGAYRTFPGKFMARISAEGFETKAVEVDLSAENTTRIYEYLMPTEGNLNYYAMNEGDAEILARVGGEDAKEMLRAISIKEVLPIMKFQYGGLNGRSSEIVISQNPDCARWFCLMATGDFEDEEQIKEMIWAKNYEPEDYEIRYVKR